jgi:hypothetical protein
MPIDPSNANELANIAREVGAHVFEGKVAFPSENAGWLVRKIDFSEDILSKLRGRRVMSVVADLGEADLKDASGYTCGICGFVMNELGECPRCKMQVADDARRLERREQERRQLGEEIDRCFDELGGHS